MLTSMEFPYRYIQGPGALAETMAAQIRMYGQNALVVCDTTADTMLSDCMLEADNPAVIVEKYLCSDACTQMEIQRIRRFAQECNADCIVAMGGAKLLDAAKVTAGELRLPIIASPIPVASESTGSNRAVIYSTEGQAESYMQLEKCVDIIIVDLELLVKSPVRFLVSAMGCTLTAWLEAESARKTGSAGGNRFVSSPTVYDLAWLCYESLLEYGHQARLDCETGQITEALERIVETNTFLSGICFSHSGASAPHAIYNGLTVLKETQNAYQGEKLAFAALASLYLNNPVPDIIRDIFSFCDSVGLPTTLKDIGLEDTSVEVLMPIAQGACGQIPGMSAASAAMDPETVMQALLKADHEGVRRRNACDQAY